jgi:hypothetical protein
MQEVAAQTRKEYRERVKRRNGGCTKVLHGWSSDPRSSPFFAGSSGNSSGSGSESEADETKQKVRAS